MTSPNPQEETVSLYEAHQTVYFRNIFGWFAKWRIALVIFTQAIFYGGAWLNWDGRQALLLHLTERKFYFFGLTLFPQDVLYLAVILIISAYSLFLFTAVAGRLFCGYACPQSVYSQIFMRIELWIEGDRNERMARDKAPMSPKKLMIKSTKHFLWIAIAFWTGFTFIGYFSPIRDLAGELLAWQIGPWQAFWLFFYSFATYGNAGWLREQVCKYMCPYARFQSVMFDKDTLIVSYDAERGEPRGSRRKDSDYRAEGKGDCIDCGMCVQVCPTGIDIRKGLQYECIGCGLCIDACNGVMDKMGYPRGLVRYTSEHGMKEHWGIKELIKHVLRPRVIFYSFILWAIITMFFVSLYQRDPLSVNILRDRSAIFRLLDQEVEGVFQIRVLNSDKQQQKISITAEGIDGIRVINEQMPFVVPPESTHTFVFAVRVPRASVGLTESVEDFRHAPNESDSDHDDSKHMRKDSSAKERHHDRKIDITFRINRENDTRVLIEKSTFIVPKNNSKDDHS